MSQLRLNNQYNFIGIFDSLDNDFKKTKSSLVFDNPNSLQIYVKFDKLSKTTFTNTLFFECMISQKFIAKKEQNAKKRNFAYSMVTIRGWKIFWFLEILLHSLFLVRQPLVNLQNAKITHLDFFWPNIVLDKFFLSILTQNSFIIYNR